MRDVSVSFVTTGAIQVVNIATGLLAARLLLPEGRGELAEIMLWPGLIAELGILALSDALLYAAATRMADPRALFAAIMAWAGILSLILVPVGLLLVPVLYGGQGSDTMMIAAWYMSFIPIYYATLFVHSLFQGTLDYATWNWLRAMIAPGYLICILVAALLGGATVAGFAAANIAAHLLALAAGVWMLGRRGWLGWRPRLDLMRGMVVFGAKAHLGEMLNTLRQRLDQALVALWLPAADLGLYVVALTIANGPVILAMTAANVAFPKISNQETEAGKIEVLGRYLRLTLIATLGSAAVLGILSPWLIPLLFGKPFAPSAPIAQILLIGLPAFGVKLIAMQALKAWGRPLTISHGEMAGLVVAAAALLVLLPAFGILGAASSLVLAQLASAAWMLATLQWVLGVRVLPLFAPRRSDLDGALLAWREATARFAR